MSWAPVKSGPFANPWVNPDAPKPTIQQPSSDLMRQLEAQLRGGKRIHGVWDGLFDGLTKAISGWRLKKEQDKQTAWDQQQTERQRQLQQSLSDTIASGGGFKDFFTANPMGIDDASKYASFFDALNKPAAERKYTEGVDGRKYYIDTGEPVFPDVEKTPETQTRTGAAGNIWTSSDGIDWTNTNKRDPAYKPDKGTADKVREWKVDSERGVRWRTNADGKYEEQSLETPLPPEGSDGKFSDVEKYGNELGKEFRTGPAADFAEIDTQYQFIDRALQEKSSVSDRAAVTTLAKILDPKTGVRGKEGENLVASTVVPTFLKQFFANIEAGGILSDNDRMRIQSAARQAFLTRYTNYKRNLNVATQLLEIRGLDPSRYLIDAIDPESVSYTHLTLPTNREV